MPIIDDASVLEALRTVQDPDLHRDIVSLGFVKQMVIAGSEVSFQIELTTPACPVKEELYQQAKSAVLSIEGVSSVNIEMTAQVRGGFNKGELIPGVKNVIAIASGKGGVGKSTVSCNLAVALAQKGAKVGLMDADVYGPSLPKMMGCEKEKPWVQDGKLIPLEKYGLKLMSLGFILEENSAVLWRGPLVAGTVKQLLADVVWGDLDYLLVDLPPGTGDAPMTLAQMTPISGVVIVLTPQDVAASIASKSITLFQKLNSPIVGVIENMSGFVCGTCGETTRIFSGIGGKEIASKFEIPFLGSIPLDPQISRSSDQGTPSLITHPESIQAQSFREIAGLLAAQISIEANVRKDLIRGIPTIVR